MSDQIANLLGQTGHASEIRRMEDKPWSRAGAGSPRLNIAALAQMEEEADKLMATIEELVERDPEGAAASNIGQLYLQKYGFLLDKNSGYPYVFQVHDVILQAPWILAQLVAEEYFEDGPEACPFTPEAFLDFDFEKGRKRKEWADPFSTYERPNVTVEAVDAKGKTETFNMDPGMAPRARPAEGFIELERYIQA